MQKPRFYVQLMHMAAACLIYFNPLINMLVLIYLFLNLQCTVEEAATLLTSFGSEFDGIHLFLNLQCTVEVAAGHA
jgi:positive regulator of sigma E activity